MYGEKKVKTVVTQVVLVLVELFRRGQRTEATIAAQSEHSVPPAHLFGWYLIIKKQKQNERNMSIIYQKLSIFVHRVEKDLWYKIVSAQDILMKKQTQAARKARKLITVANCGIQCTRVPSEL